MPKITFFVINRGKKKDRENTCRAVKVMKIESVLMTQFNESNY